MAVNDADGIDVPADVALGLLGVPQGLEFSRLRDRFGVDREGGAGIVAADGLFPVVAEGTNYRETCSSATSRVTIEC